VAGRAGSDGCASSGGADPIGVIGAQPGNSPQCGSFIAVLAVLGSLLLSGARCGPGAKGGDNVDPNKYVDTPSSSTTPGMPTGTGTPGG
jgi:hypothetical protein